MFEWLCTGSAFRGGSGRDGAPQRGSMAGGRGAGGGQGRGRAQNRPPREPLKFDGEFDFESSNAQFDKEQIEKELKEKLTLGG